jgi:MFS family permease
MTKAAVSFETPSRRALLAGLLAWTMVSATASVGVLSVMATFIIEDFGITRTQFGVLVTSLTAGAAVASPIAGRIVDRVGGRNAVLAVFVGSSSAALIFATAPVFAMMFLGSALALVVAGANPGTNKLLASLAPAGRQGFVAGIKQTGPQVGSLLAGLLAPLGAATLGWRPTIALLALLSLAAVPLVLAVIPPDELVGRAAMKTQGPLPGGIRWLAVLALFLGLGNSSMLFLPLFVEEELGQANYVAGLVVALRAGVAIFGRIAWARTAERTESSWIPTAVIGALSVVSAVAMLLAARAGIGWAWIGAVIAGLASGSWTAVGVITIITMVGPGTAGRATGLVWLGFLGGLAIGPPIYGWTVDQTGSYITMWWLVAAAFALMTLGAVLWGRMLGKRLRLETG